MFAVSRVIGSEAFAVNEMLMEENLHAQEDSATTHATSLVKRLRMAIMTGELALVASCAWMHCAKSWV